MLDILKIIYQFENHAATTFEIRAVRKKLGFSDEKSYNSLIVQNGKRVKSYFNKEPITNSMGEESYWNWFFDGEYLNGQNKINTSVKVGKSGKKENKGWSLSRNDLTELIPIDDYEGDYPIIVDGIEDEGKLNLNTRLFYKSEKLREHLVNLAKIDPNKKIPLEIKFKDENKKGFEFKLKKELEDAIKTKYSNLEIKYPHNSHDLLDKLLDDDSSMSLDNFNQENGLNDFGSFYEYLLENGYYFDKETIENYLLSLKVKPFAILTGNSGTGKTKLSQLFAQYISVSKSEKPILNDISNEYVVDKVKVGQSYKVKGGWSIPREKLAKLIPLDLYNYDCEFIVDGIPVKGSFNINSQFFYDSPELSAHLKELSKKNPKQYVEFKVRVLDSKKSNNFKGLDLWNDNEVIDKEIKCEFNYKIIPVGANWTENRNIVGYYNLITEEYQSTPAYELIKESQSNFDSPYFLILDEMNLSHVERYFADFLSAIESGENIPLYGIEEDLEIPDNLFIIGTVNVDETTYMFSPKVLDRANVLEFNTFSSKDYMLGNIDLNAPNGDISYLENPLSDSNIKKLGINELKDIFDGVEVKGDSFWNILSDEIFKFQEILKESGFDFGFRVINEIVRFMVVSWRYEGEPIEWTNWERYFDAQIKQKLLPKLHGSEKILGDTLQDLAKACESEDGIKYYTSAKKLDEMIKVLDKQRYVSFIN